MKTGYEFERLQTMKDSNGEWAYGAWKWGLGTDSGVWILAGLLGWGSAFSEDFGAWDMYCCHHVRTLIFRVMRRGAGVEPPKKTSPSFLLVNHMF